MVEPPAVQVGTDKCDLRSTCHSFYNYRKDLFIFLCYTVFLIRGQILIGHKLQSRNALGQDLDTQIMAAFSQSAITMCILMQIQAEFPTEILNNQLRALCGLVGGLCSLSAF